MSEAEVTQLLKEKCQGGRYESRKQEDSRSGVVHSSMYQCRLSDVKEVVYVEVADKAFLVTGVRNINYPDNLSRADQEAMFYGVYQKLLDKYGKPTHEGPKGKKARKVEAIPQEYNQAAACWGDCQMTNPDEYYEITAGQEHYAAVALYDGLTSPLIIVSRALKDVKAEQAADAAADEAIKVAQEKATEDAKKQSQQATENIKF